MRTCHCSLKDRCGCRCLVNVHHTNGAMKVGTGAEKRRSVRLALCRLGSAPLRRLYISYVVAHEVPYLSTASAGEGRDGQRVCPTSAPLDVADAWHNWHS